MDFQLSAEGSNGRKRIAGAEIGEHHSLFREVHNPRVNGVAPQGLDAERNHPCTVPCRTKIYNIWPAPNPPFPE